MTISAAVGLVRAFLQTTTGLLVLLQVTMSAYRLPKQISDELAVFEDALGRFQRIDLRFIDNWLVFRRRLECDFQGTPGSQRILNMEYRLVDRFRGDHIVDPRHPPPFASVFKDGRHVQMSMHFEWHEVSDEQCPKCGLSQECIVNAETICARCKFTYRGQVESSRVEEDGEDSAPLHGSRSYAWDTARLSTYQQDQDKPAYFSRISISRTPMRNCLNCSKKWVRLRDRCDYCNYYQPKGDDRNKKLYDSNIFDYIV